MFKTLKSVLEQSSLVSIPELYDDVFRNPNGILVVGEGHYSDMFVANDMELMHEASRRRIPFTVYVENLCPEIINEIPKTDAGFRRLRELGLGIAKETRHYVDKDEGINHGEKYFWPIFRTAFSLGNLRSFGYNGETIGLTVKKTERLADMLNSEDSGDFKLAICGIDHVARDNIKGRLKNTNSYSEIRQLNELKPEIVRRKSGLYELNVPLRRQNQESF